MKPEEIITAVLKEIVKLAEVGRSLKELDAQAEQLVLMYGAKPYNKGYHPKWAKEPYPATLCLGVNDVIAHGIPTDYKLQNGDLLSIDLGIIIDGKCGDSGLTIGIGELSNKDARLLYYAKNTLYAGIEKVKAGVTIREVAKAMELYASLRGYVTNQNLSGHGIGREMHMPPKIPAFTYINDPVKDLLLEGAMDYKLKDGETICLEPFLTYKDKSGFVSQVDGWTVRTRDGKKSAFFEHMLRVTKNGCDVLTQHISKNEPI